MVFVTRHWYVCSVGINYIFDPITRLFWTRLPDYFGPDYPIILDPITRLFWTRLPDDFWPDYPIILDPITRLFWTRLPDHFRPDYPIILDPITRLFWTRLPDYFGPDYPIIWDSISSKHLNWTTFNSIYFQHEGRRIKAFPFWLQLVSKLAKR